MDLVDSHCHLTFDPLLNDIEQVLERARAVGVSEIVVPAYDRDSWQTVSDLSVRPGVHGAFGIHPWCADEGVDTVELGVRLRQPGAVAIGEIGLDFAIEAGRQPQLEIFEKQVRLAADLDLPVILHCRAAFADMLAVLGRYAPRLRGVVHAFSRGPDLARQFLELGFSVAFGGAVTRPGAKRARRSAAVVPGNRILLETDAPSIGLEGVPAEHTEPRHVRDVAQALAALRGDSLETIARQTTANARSLFGI